ncbi:MAG: hypothetical protein L6R38_004841 [Xanthoria sp. 2 TBL-2021]|nr:MAG: hypothetical protein L6R38_004841 [Xanthoria sp. 2 TBL-2021]
MAINIKNTKKKPSPDIQSLQSDAQCWHKIKILLFDLRNLDERMDSKARLDLVTDRSYISAPYFTPSEIKAIKSFVPDGGESTLEQLILSALETKLERRKKKQLANGDYRVCASHDLAPVFEKAFGVRPKDLAKDKKFVKALTKDGLVLR